MGKNAFMKDAKPETTYLARFLRKLTTGPGGRSPKDLASDLTIVKSHLSHILTGKRRSFNFETVAKMVEGVSEDPKVQGEFLKNYLLDQCTDKNRALIEIQVTGSADPAGSNFNEAAPRMPDAIDRFCTHLRNVDVKEETLDVFRRLLDQAEASDALFSALASLADLDIQPKRKQGDDWDEFNDEARARTEGEHLAPSTSRRKMDFGIDPRKVRDAKPVKTKE